MSRPTVVIPSSLSIVSTPPTAAETTAALQETLTGEWTRLVYFHQMLLEAPDERSRKVVYVDFEQCLVRLLFASAIISFQFSFLA